MRRSILLMATAATLGSPFVVSGQTTALQVRTKQGVVRGLALPSGVRAFRGIPFAKPPVRERRWQPPAPPAPWTGVREADRFSPMCMQARLFSDMVFRSDGTSEDCLYLNVWAPAKSARAALPVLVYFYGGGLSAGDGSELRYDGESMATQDIVAVTVNYRLGIFGSFVHPELIAESSAKAAGNYGFLDQQAALRWVQANIAAFGGDPARVTIAGESAGSFSVSAQMTAPGSTGLFARAIGESGSLIGRGAMMTLEVAATNGERFAAGVGAPNLAALRALGATQLLDWSARADLPRFGPVVDGRFFPESPTARLERGAQAKVPLLAGWNELEASGRGLLRGDTTAAGLSAALTQAFGANAAEAAAHYPASDGVIAAANAVAGDQFIGFSTWRWIDLHARTSGQPVYRYFFTRARPALAKPPTGRPNLPEPGAVHSAEIEYAMGNLRTNVVYAWTPDDFTVSRVMQRYFVNFIKTGNPNGADLPEWPSGVPADGRAMRMRIDVTSKAEPEPRARYLFLERVWAGK